MISNMLGGASLATATFAGYTFADNWPWWLSALLAVTAILLNSYALLKAEEG
jgi:hypothetical protein